MARQIGSTKIEGTIGDVTFYKTADGYLVRRKGSVSKQRIKTDPAFAGTRANMEQFKRAAAAGKLFRQAFREHVIIAGDGTITARLVRAMSQVINSDMAHPPGQRSVNNGDGTLLDNFQFNDSNSLEAVLAVPLTVAVSGPRGLMEVDVAAFAPDHALRPPAAATHFRLRCAGAAIDFDGGQFDVARQQTELMPVHSGKVPGIKFRHDVKTFGVGHCVVVLAVEFVSVVSGKEVRVRGNAGRVVGVSALG